MRAFGRGPFTLLTLLICLSGCQEGTSDQTNITQQVFSSKVSELHVEVDYMPGAEPYITDPKSGTAVWKFFEHNLSALFEHTKRINVPTDLSMMEEIPAGRKDYTPEDIFALASEHRDIPEITGSVVSLYILFLDGKFKHNGQVTNTVLAVSVTGTTIIAIFKPIIESDGLGSPRLKRFTEQTTLIHEAGHAIGLVNNGLVLTSDHHDHEHGSHCTNDQCVMYYLNEGIQDLKDFVSLGRVSVETVIFGDECIRDAVHALN